MTYAPPKGREIYFDGHALYSPPKGSEISFPVDGGTVAPVATIQASTPDFDVPWGEYPVKEKAARAGWKGRRAISRGFLAAWMMTAAKEAAGTRSTWGTPAEKDLQRLSSWGETVAVDGMPVQSPWTDPAHKDIKRRIEWAAQESKDKGKVLPYLSPPRMQRETEIAFAQAKGLDRKPFDVPWGSPPPKDLLHRTLWGRKYYEEICNRNYVPPDGGSLNFNLHVPISQVGDKDNINFHFEKLNYDLRCKWREPSGWRDAYFYRPIDPVAAGVSRRFYHVLNQALLTRLPERTPIDVSSITLSTDVDSWCWSLSATLNSVAALDLIRPGAPVDVEVSINGHVWVLQVERWREGRRFLGGERSVTGRSRSAELSAPSGPLLSLSDGNAATAEQLAAAALDAAALEGASGWSIDWDLVDWLVPGGLWSVAEQTPLQIIQDIAECGGGFVQTHCKDKALLLQPRYATVPWAWGTVTPDMIVPEAMIITMDGAWEPKTQYNAAFVSGTAAGGISAKVVRAGTAGDSAPAMVTHPLMADTDVALAKGRALIAASGDWETKQLTLPLFADPTAPGLVLPGKLLQVNRSGSSWRGQVIGTTINANRTGGGVVVRQTLEVERYHGN